MIDGTRHLSIIAGAVALLSLTACQTTNDSAPRMRAANSGSVDVRWERIAPAESQISLGSNPRVLQRRARRDTSAGIYAEVSVLPNGSILYEKRRLQGSSNVLEAGQELLRRWKDDAALKAAGISLANAKVATGSGKSASVHLTVGHGTSRTCAIFFRYSPGTKLDQQGVPQSRYEAITGALCEPNGASAEAAAREAALQLASKVLFDGGKAAQTALFSKLLEGHRDQLLGENLLKSAAAAPAAEAPKPAPGPAVTSIVMNGVNFGRYHALVLGAQDYLGGIPRLETPANDARKVSTMLKDRYGFEVRTIVDPTKANIIGALAYYSRHLGPKDNLLIYYAGHGFVDKRDNQGYWLPIGPANSVADTWISNKALSAAIQSIKASHVLVVSDSCFSGTLVEGQRTRVGAGSLSLRQWESLRARTALASGGLELVDDDVGNGHSPFATSFLSLLSTNDGMLSGGQLAALVRSFVHKISSQTPEYGNILSAGHQIGADFFFIRKQPAITGS